MDEGSGWGSVCPPTSPKPNTGLKRFLYRDSCGSSSFQFDALSSGPRPRVESVSLPACNIDAHPSTIHINAKGILHTGS